MSPRSGDSTCCFGRTVRCLGHNGVRRHESIGGRAALIGVRRSRADRPRGSGEGSGGTPCRSARRPRTRRRRQSAHRRLRGHQHPRRLLDPDLGHEARRRRSGSRAEEVAEVGAAHAVLGGKGVDADRSPAAARMRAQRFEQALALAFRMAELLGEPLVREEELEQRQTSNRSRKSCGTRRARAASRSRSAGTRRRSNHGSRGRDLLRDPPQQVRVIDADPAERPSRRPLRQVVAMPRRNHREEAGPRRQPLRRPAVELEVPPARERELKEHQRTVAPSEPLHPVPVVAAADRCATRRCRSRRSSASTRKGPLEASRAASTSFGAAAPTRAAAAARAHGRRRPPRSAPRASAPPGGTQDRRASHSRHSLTNRQVPATQAVVDTMVADIQRRQIDN